MSKPKPHHANLPAEMNFPFRPTTAGFYIEPGPDTPPSLRHEIEVGRANTIQPIPLGLPRWDAPVGRAARWARELALRAAGRVKVWTPWR